MATLIKIESIIQNPESTVAPDLGNQSMSNIPPQILSNYDQSKSVSIKVERSPSPNINTNTKEKTATDKKDDQSKVKVEDSPSSNVDTNLKQKTKKKKKKKIKTDPTQKKLLYGIKEISTYCSRLSFGKDVEIFAGELYKELVIKNQTQGRKLIIFIACCVYIAAKQYQCDRPIKELCKEFGIEAKALRRVHSKISKLRATEKIIMPTIKRGQGVVQKSAAEMYAVKYAYQLKLSMETIKNLQKISRKINEKGILSGKDPSTIAAATIYLTCIVNEDGSQARSYTEISVVSKMSTSTIRRAFEKYLFPRRMALIPEGYGDPSEIKMMDISR